MRRLIALLLSTLALSVAAQTRPKLEPIPEPPPPPAGLNEALEPQVTITKRGEDKVEEFRMSGKLYMMKVTPPHGVPYYLIDNAGNGIWSRQDVRDSGLRVPMWVIGTF
ncbi:DUF2782 domain-containing protein [Sulfuritalea hydrogenivorans]|jgi:hypothetical protein|uniref:DUF2782 domain-containing protein n=1 Tax=Sulfuritalea hydrogenivorans sk43H TaxID=1223802 RepID=W0SNB2_9PROT|nr:DUF2782 domain-containing protein [Sulfuritalea hydrogenivorans]BAO31293.1 hypothetical protein SUTH_03523 [Sulfuritalea hydrogenivorans sk43H]